MTTNELSCQATNTRGEPCGAPSSMVDPDSGLCPAHREGGRERLRQAAKKGGEAMKRRLKGEALNADELPPLTDPRAAETWLETVARAVATGRLTHNEGRTIARLVREWLRAREAGAVEERMETLEERLAALKRGELEVA